MTGERTRAPRADVVVVGSFNVDRIMRVPHIPCPGESLSCSSMESFSGGKGANQALAAAKSGASVALLACIGSDIEGSTHLDELRDAGVDLSLIKKVDDSETGSATILVTESGENVIVICAGANHRLTTADLDGVSRVLANARVVVLQLEIPIEVSHRVALLVPPTVTVILNAAPYCALPADLLERVDLLVVNEIEAQELVGAPVSSVAGALVAAVRLRENGPNAVLVTLGESGAVLATEDGCEHLPARSVKVIDTTGAGDAVVGAVAAKLAQGWRLRDAAVFGLSVGTATTESRGARAIVPTLIA